MLYMKHNLKVCIQSNIEILIQNGIQVHIQRCLNPPQEARALIMTIWAHGAHAENNDDDYDDGDHDDDGDADDDG